MRSLFEGIKLSDVSTSMTINAPAAVLLAMYSVVAEEQGAELSQISGTVQNDVLKEYMARGLHIHPPEGSMRLAVDIIEWCSENAPKWNPISVSGYHIREAGSTAAQEVGLTISNALAYIEAARTRTQPRCIRTSNLILFRMSSRFSRRNMQIPCCSYAMVSDYE